MKNNCPFCDKDKISNRLFYDKHYWLGFHAAPYHTKGHAILAANKISKCPSKLSKVDMQHWQNLGIAVKEVSEALMNIYKPKDILYSSVRGDIPHFHFHLIPLWNEEEDKWRDETGYTNGHLLEFLGNLESSGDKSSERERHFMGWDGTKQRSELESLLKTDIRKLRQYTQFSE